MASSNATAKVHQSELVFIDRDVSDIEILRAGLRPGVEAVVLERGENAPAQIARTMAGRAGIEAIHIVAHGQPGQVSFAGQPLSLESLDDYGSEFAAIGRALGTDGTLALWCCHTADGDAGRAFIDALADATGAQVAASADLVGAEACGGTWKLGVLGAAAAIRSPLSEAGMAAYPGVMTDAPTISSITVNGDGSITVSGTTKSSYTVGLFSVPAGTDISPKVQGDFTYEASQYEIADPNVFQVDPKFGGDMGVIQPTGTTWTYTIPTAVVTAQNLVGTEIFAAAFNGGAKTISPPSNNFVATIDNDGVSEAPTLTFNATPNPVIEGSNVALDITVTGKDSDDTLSVTISGLPSDGTLTNDANQALTVANDGSITLTPDQLAGLTLHTNEFGGTITVTATNSEPGDVSQSSSSISLTVNEPAATLLVDGGGDPTVNAAGAQNVAFTLGNMDADDTATVTFTDSSNNTVVVTVGSGSHTVDLSSLNDGTIASSVTVNGTGNPTTTGNSITLDADKGEAPTLTVNGGNATILTASAGQVSVSLSGVEGDESGTVTLSDGVPADNVTLSVVNGTVQGSADLTGMADGSVTASFAVSDAAGNSFSGSGNATVLDQDTDEAPALSVNGGNATILTANAGAVSVSLNGLEGDDNGTVTLSDGVPADNVTLSVVNGTVQGSADLTGMADGSVTASFAVSDAAGNSFSGSGNATVLDQDKDVKPTVAFTNAVINAGEAKTETITVAGLDTDDGTGVVGLTVGDGDGHTATAVAGVVDAYGNGTYTVDVSGLADTTLTATLSAGDAAGNSFGGTATASLDQDLDVKPTVAFTNAVINHTEASAETITVGGLDPDDNSGGTLTVTDGTHTKTATVAGNGGYTFDLSGFSDATITASLTAGDTAGNSFGATTTASMDQDLDVKPTVTFADTPINLAHAGSEKITIGGLDLDDGLPGMLVISDGSHSVTVNNVSDGTYTVNLTGLVSGNAHDAITATLTESDKAGNTFSATANDVLDLMTPVKPVINVVANGGVYGSPYAWTQASPTPQVIDAYSSNGTFTIKGFGTYDSVAQAGDTITIWDSNHSTIFGTTTVQADGTWTYNATGLSDGEHSFQAKQTDWAGNMGPISNTYDVQVDDTKPVVSIRSVTPGSSAWKLTGGYSDQYGTAPGSIALLDNGTQVATANWVASNNANNWDWSVTDSASGVNTSVHYFSVKATSLTGMIGQSAVTAEASQTGQTLLGITDGETLIGVGKSDTFDFSHIQGSETVANFAAGNGGGHDLAILAQASFANFASVTSHAQQVGGNTVISDGHGDSLTLANVKVSALTASDFQFKA